jgi:nitroreductase
VQETQTETATPFTVLASILDSRHSCRGFHSRRVPESQIECMLQLAQKAPSWCNTQPWKVSILSGAAKERLSEALIKGALKGGKHPDIEAPADYRGVYLSRRRESGYALYASLGIDRHEYERRAEQGLENYRFFGAPHVAIVTTDALLGTYGAIDCGGYVATLLLAAASLGISTVPQAAVAMYSDIVREQLNLSDDRLIVCAVSFGYEDASHPANQFRTSRATLGDVVDWQEA